LGTETAAAIVGVVALALVLWWRRRSSPGRAGLPPELRRVRLVHAERLFRSEEPIPLVAQLDRAYRNAAGVLVLIELKTRAASRAYGSDVIELSAQRLALAAQTGDVVADHAYVLTQHPDGRQTGWHFVRLLAHTDVVALALRRKELLAGNTEPRLTDSPGVCRECVFLRSCRPPWR
jgi:CRISPR-associated exonuclease Cas4